MAEEENTQQVENKLMKALKNAKSVTTSQGTVYVKHLSLNVFKRLGSSYNENKSKDSHDLKALGEHAIKTLTFTDADPEKLSEEVFSQLNSKDIELLIDAIVESSQLELLGDKTLESLGSIIFDELEKFIKNSREASEKLRSAFSSLPTDIFKSLEDSISSLNLARDSLKLSPIVEDFRKTQEDRARLWRGLGYRGLAAQANIMQMQPPKIPELQPIKFEETSHGRITIAAEDSAAQLREVAGSVGDMAEKLTGLHAVFLTEVIPEWQSNIEDNLKWAKRTLVVSILVTVLMTAWQVWIAHDYKLENDKQQVDSISLMRDQLKSSNDLSKRLTNDSRQMREELVRLRKSLDMLEANQLPKSKIK
jgi:hypothetical protein